MVWVATELGLNRFAGNTFYHYYKTKQAAGVSVDSNEINKLLYDNQHLYIGPRANYVQANGNPDEKLAVRFTAPWLKVPMWRLP